MDTRRFTNKGAMMVSLEERRYSMDEWNNEIMPLVEDGTFEQVKTTDAHKFLPIYCVFYGELLWDEEVFSCTGWKSPDNDPPYVNVKRIGKRAR